MGSKLRSRSVSLNRIPGGTTDSPEKKCSKSKGYTKRKRDSPPPMDGVKTKRMIFKEKLALKYQAQRNAKESARSKMKSKNGKPKKESLDDESSIAILLKEIRGDIKEIKADNREIKNDMKSMSSKIETIEKKQLESEEKTANKFDTTA